MTNPPLDFQQLLSGGPSAAGTDTGEAGQPKLGNDPFPKVPYTSMSKEQWQDYLGRALQAFKSGDRNALVAITKANHALNSYDAQDISPSAGQLLGAEAKGVAQFPEQAFRGIGQVGTDLFTNPAKVPTDILGGVAQFGKGLGQLPSTAATVIGGGDAPPRDALLNQAKGYGSSTAAIGAMAAPKLAAAARNMAPSAAIESPSAATGEAAQTGSSATPPQPLTPLEGTQGYGYTAEGPPTPPVTPAMESLSQMRGLGEAGSMSPELAAALGALGWKLATGGGAIGALKNLNFGSVARGAVPIAGASAALSPTDSTGVK